MNLWMVYGWYMDESMDDIWMIFYLSTKRDDPYNLSI